jgi:hypothetical protein
VHATSTSASPSIPDVLRRRSERSKRANSGSQRARRDGIHVSWLERVLPLSGYHDLLNCCQSQNPTRTISEPTKADTTSRSEIDTLSRLGNSPSIRNSKPPISAPARPTTRFRKKPKPRRSQVISGPARLPPSRPTMIQTMS